MEIYIKSLLAVSAIATIFPSGFAMAETPAIEVAVCLSERSGNP